MVSVLDIPREGLLNASYKEHCVVTTDEITIKLKPSGRSKFFFNNLIG